LLIGIQKVLDFANSQHETLTHLAIKNHHDTNHCPQFKAMKKLEYLSYFLYYDQQEFVKFPASLKTLKLTLQNYYSGIVLTHEMPNLENVILKLDNVSIYEETMTSVIRNCPKKARIDFTKCYQVDDDIQCLMFFEHYFLKEPGRIVFEVTLDKLAEIWDDDLISLLEDQPKMVKMTIHNGVGLSGNFGIFIPYIGQNLKVMKIFNYPQFELDSVKQFLQDRPDFRLYTSAWNYHVISQKIGRE
jgi:hypothetical protein